MFGPTLIVAIACLAGLIVIATVLLRGWSDWLSLKRSELESRSCGSETAGSSMGAARIELADLKERIKKLEAIASGVDL